MFLKWEKSSRQHFSAVDWVPKENRTHMGSNRDVHAGGKSFLSVAN